MAHLRPDPARPRSRAGRQRPAFFGPLQLAPGFRQRHPRLHRTLDRLLIPASLIVAVTGLWMAHFHPWPTGDGMLVYVERLAAGTGMLWSILKGTDAVRRRAFVVHGEWMLRAFAIGLGAGTQVITHLPWFLLVDRTPGELPRGVMMSAAWPINVMVAEYVIRRERARQVVTRATTFRTRGATMATVGNATGHVVRQLRSQAEGKAALHP